MKGTPEKLSLRWTNGTVRHESESMRVVVTISGEGENQHKYQLRDVRTVQSLDLPRQNINKVSLVKKYPYLSRIPFTDFDSAPRILIGLDNIKLCCCVVERTHRRALGRTLCVEEFFSLESFGIRALTNSIDSKDDQRARKIMDESTVRNNDRFESGLLWKFDNIQLPNNYAMALKRLECQDKRMQSNPALKENINSQIRKFVEKGYARKLTMEEANSSDPRIWYLPVFHHLDPKNRKRLDWSRMQRRNIEEYR